MTAAMQTWFWLGALGTLVGALYFGLGAYSARKVGDTRAEILYQLTFFVSVLAAVLYLGLASGYGAIEAGEGPGTRTVWLRHVVWLFSSPLLITILIYLGRTRLTTATALLGSSVLGVVTAFLATIATDSSRFTFFFLWLGALVALAYLLLRPYRQEVSAAYPNRASSFNLLIGAYVLIWALYPVVWLLSPEGWGWVGSTMEVSLLMTLDLLAIVGFGLLAVSTHAQLSGGEPIQPGNLIRSEASHS